MPGAFPLKLCFSLIFEVLNVYLHHLCQFRSPFLPHSHLVFLSFFPLWCCYCGRAISGPQNMLSPQRTGWSPGGRSSVNRFNRWQDDKKELVDTYVSVLAFGWGSFETWCHPEVSVAHSDWLIITSYIAFIPSFWNGLPNKLAFKSNSDGTQY